jgi:hypothetical protein
MWNDTEDYLQWLYDAREHLRNSKFVYDKKRRRIFYNKQYWLYRFQLEIKRIEDKVLLERRLKTVDCEAAA